MTMVNTTEIRSISKIFLCLVVTSSKWIVIQTQTLTNLKAVVARVLSLC